MNTRTNLRRERHRKASTMRMQTICKFVTGYIVTGKLKMHAEMALVLQFPVKSMEALVQSKPVLSAVHFCFIIHCLLIYELILLETKDTESIY